MLMMAFCTLFHQGKRDCWGVEMLLELRVCNGAAAVIPPRRSRRMMLGMRYLM
jgi:hypothetical protein